jgi:hypothetical protein
LIIRLDVSDAKDAFKLFETINNRGLKLSPTDIIKNFVLGNAARFGIDQLNEARKSWALLISYLDGADTDAFFRYFLISATQRRITKSQVVPEFKWLFMNEVFEAEKLPDRHLYADEDEIDDDEPDQAGDVEDVTIERGGTANVTFKDFLRRVVTSAKVFGDLVLIRTGDKRIDRHLRNLRMIGADIRLSHASEGRRHGGQRLRRGSQDHRELHSPQARLPRASERDGDTICQTLFYRSKGIFGRDKGGLSRCLPFRRKVPRRIRHRELYGQYHRSRTTLP